MSKDVIDWVGEQVGKGEPAGNFAPHVPVWSEFAVRAAIVRAVESYEKGRQEEQKSSAL